MKFTELLKIVESATTAEDVVGPDDDGRKKRLRRARVELYPDMLTATTPRVRW